tara:strand:- start:3633 stop:4451 length:819 start_codon:yes stop_codon:yes gene_type:complete
LKITASEVKKLRQATGAGMMDCKKALVESEGDFNKAVENLRKKGQKVAANRADRQSSEGAVLAKVNANKTGGVIVSLNCETDFVAKNDSYIKLANELANLALSCDTLEDFLGSAFEGITVAEKLTEQTGVIGEKIEIGGFKTLKAPYVGSYIHAGNKIATLVGLSKTSHNVAEVAKNIAMQVAAMNPIALNEEHVDASLVEKEIEISKEQLRQEGKPEAMLDNIVKGKIKRFYKENTLVNQDFIKDSKVSVATYVKSAGDMVVTGFERIALV